MSSARRWRGCVFIATSLDGYIARPDGDIEWLTDPPVIHGHSAGQPGSDGPKAYQAFMATVDHLVMGRGTYEKVLTFSSWPYGEKQVIVLSRTLQQAGDDRITVARSLEEAVVLLETRAARGVYIDGGKVIQEFLSKDLVDEITISRAPVLIGAGLTLFGTLDAGVWLIHAGTTSSDSGMTSSLLLRLPLSDTNWR